MYKAITTTKTESRSYEQAINGTSKRLNKGAIWTVFVICLFTYSSMNLRAQTILIPDAEFEQALINQGYDSNGMTGNILESDALDVTDLDVHGEGIQSIEGITQ